MAVEKNLSIIYIILILIITIYAFKHYELIQTKIPQQKIEIDNLDPNKVISITSINVETENGKIEIEIKAYRSFLKPTWRKTKITITLENSKGEIIGIAEKTIEASPGQIINTTIILHTKEKGKHILKIELKTGKTTYKTQKIITTP